MNRPKNLEMAVLTQISRAAVREKNVAKLFREVLEILFRSMGLVRGTITLRQGDLLFIEASHGLSDAEQKRGKYRLGEGITGQVAQSGQPRVIPDVSREPAFLDRTGARQTDKNIAFICVPIIHSDEVIGTMSFDRRAGADNDLERDMNLLEIVSNLLADAVSISIREHEEREQLLNENNRLRRELDRSNHPAELVGNCNSMKSIYSTIAQVADSNATVLIRGGSGTGKELIARAIQRAGARRDKPFIVVNCAALPENLIESELFGHEKGAFTGAVSRRIGRVEAADTGTLFLDEIGDLAPPMQVKLLRFIQERTFQRIGSNEDLRADVRILAATSRNLEQLMASGRFREDLYYRLNVVPIHLPDLVNRRSDILLLAEHFLEKYNRRHRRQVRRISTPAINMMMAYHWPGNVRELENCIERAVLTSDGEVINGYNLPPTLQLGSGDDDRNTELDPAAEADFTTMVESFERELIVDALKKQRGNVAAAARVLGVTARIVRYKIAQLGITPDWYKR
ncbi:MAG: sigma 54-interacting transcriptional regulator [Victivallaceae bacterium]